MPALIVTITGDANKLKAEMDKIDAMAKRTGQNIKTAMRGDGGHGMGGLSSGAMRETLVLLREIGRGNWSRVPGSLSILMGQLGAMRLLLNPITAAVVGLVAGFVAAYKLTGALVERLSGLKFPDIHPEYIAKHLQKINQAAEAQKEINREIEKTTELYNSAAKAAERVAEATKKHFDHQRKMNEYAEEKEMNEAKTDSERKAIREKYADIELKTNDAERAKEEADKASANTSLLNESDQKKAEGDSIDVSSKEHDQDIVRQRKEQADAARKYLKDLEDSKNTTGGKAKEAVIRGYNAVALSGVSGADLKAAEKANKEEARRRIQAANEAVEMEASNDEKRKRKSDLYKSAEQSAAKGTAGTIELQNMRKTNAQKAADEREESAAKLDAENAKSGRSKMRHGHVNSLQAIGAYAPGASSSHAMLDVNKKMDHKLGEILKALHKGDKGSSSGPTMGKVKF